MRASPNRSVARDSGYSGKQADTTAYERTASRATYFPMYVVPAAANIPEDRPDPVQVPSRHLWLSWLRCNT